MIGKGTLGVVCATLVGIGLYGAHAQERSPGIGARAAGRYRAFRATPLKAPDGTPVRGKQHLLVIGINRYQHWPELRGARPEAEKLAQ
ncbi:MAG: hypothetical protein HON70_08620, partial [Lentisphaerae bacterium]|nr:hypothetical protein [Lentisphaerota bacterium]